MITIPTAMRTLLKSKVMVGDNRPSAKVEVEGMPASSIFTDIIYSEGKVLVHQCDDGTTAGFYSNFITDVSGVEFCIVRDLVSGILKKGVMANNEDYLIKDHPITALYDIGVTIANPALSTGSYFPTYLYKRFDGSILLLVYHKMTTSQDSWMDCYKSATGSGEDFIFQCEVFREAYSTSNVSDNKQGIVNIIKTSTGAFILNIAAVNRYSSAYAFTGARICRSEDLGATWTTTYRQISFSKNEQSQIVQLSDGTIMGFLLYGGTSRNIFKSTNDGVTWVLDDINDAALGWNNTAVYPFPTGLLVKGAHIYMVTFDSNETQSIFCYIENYTDYAQIRNFNTWMKTDSYFNYNPRTFTSLYENYAGRIVYQFYYSNYNKMAGFEAPPPVIFPVKSIEVDMSKGMASQSTIVIENVGGIYTPDKAGAWSHRLWPNKQVVVKLGYGATQPAVFTGLIDKVSIRSFPQEIEITCRDMLKRALDQLVYLVTGDARTIYTVLYQWQTPEYIFRDLAVKAGWADANVYTEYSGITIEAITFTHEAIADAFQRLAEMSGFEFYCDEIGVLRFVHATDRSPALTSVSATMIGTDYTGVVGIPAGYPMVDGSVVVKIAGGAVTYVEDLDYTVRLGSSTENAAICRIEGGSITDGQTVYVSCVYAAWVFKEGEDIISLDYSITDQEIYRRIIVISQDANGKFVRGDEDFDGVQYYGVLPHKVMIVQAGDLASSNEQCTSIAERTGAATLTKPREATFEAVGNPYIQVGDCIQVIESSSTISEIYRITSLTHSVTPAGYRTRMTAYHYGYAPI